MAGTGVQGLHSRKKTLVHIANFCATTGGGAVVDVGIAKCNNRGIETSAFMMSCVEASPYMTPLCSFIKSAKQPQFTSAAMGTRQPNQADDSDPLDETINTAMRIRESTKNCLLVFFTNTIFFSLINAHVNFITFAAPTETAKVFYRGNYFCKHARSVFELSNLYLSLICIILHNHIVSNVFYLLKNPLSILSRRTQRFNVTLNLFPHSLKYLTSLIINLNKLWQLACKPF